MNARVRNVTLVVSVVWLYDSLSDVLSTISVHRVFAAMHVADLYAPLLSRLLQHLFLYPILLYCASVSDSIGWYPLTRRLPAQLLLGVGFALLGLPFLTLGDICTGSLVKAPHVAVASWQDAVALEGYVWLATAAKLLLAYAFAITLATGFEYYRKYRDSEVRSARLERELATARLVSLRMQLSPHSLFNLLHTIHGEIDWNPTGARSLVVQFGDLLRSLLRASDQEYWHLRDEVQFARLYLSLEQKRYPERLHVQFLCPDDLLAAWVPSLILQPLVENAVLYGMFGNNDAVEITVEVKKSAEQMQMQVINTVANVMPRRSNGVGLKNVRERLAIHFQGQASVRSSRSGTREWTAEIRMPAIFELLCSQPI